MYKWTALPLIKGNPQPFWAFRQAALPLSRRSLPKANGTYQEPFHSIPSAADFLPDTKKCTILKCNMGCHSPLSPPAQLSTTLKTEGDPREAADKIPFHLVSNFVFLKRFLSIISLYLMLFLWGMAGQVCLPLSSDGEREAPSAKTRTVTGLAKSQSFLVLGRIGNQGLLNHILGFF